MIMAQKTTLKEATTYFAIQVMSFETRHDLVEKIIRTAIDQNTLFSRIDVLDNIQVGATTYSRFRTDLTNVTPILNVFAAQNRGVISLGEKGYLVRTHNKTGYIPFLTMQVASPNNAPVTYRGPKIEYWERQFIKEEAKKEDSND